MDRATPSTPSIDPLANLPDRPALEQLSRALWSRGALRGAAVLVGAGVSRGGARLLSDDARPPPLWFELANGMVGELYGPQHTNVQRDPLRLAEEFRVGLGDAAMTDFLRRSIQDESIEPGPIHEDLLNLPWADILTTNYDTLLERARSGSKRSYDIVVTENELSHATGPRIIKLHGSLRDGSGVVISEEDYRTYPERKAAFVNTARQVFIENELCLLGFSGDDPNFLQWAGWVRDRLGGGARRIYLVGALDLPPVKRRLLEARGIAPIDLAPAVAGERPDHRHATAISLFLAHLKSARPAEPSDWKPTPYQEYPSLRSHKNDEWARNLRDPQKVVTVFRNALEIWRRDRRKCPSWLICPRDVRLSIRHGTDRIENLPLALDTLPENERRDALLELAWRQDRGAQTLTLWQAERMDAILTSENLAEAEPELVNALARTILKTARIADDDEVFTRRVGSLEALGNFGDLSATIAHEQCLFAYDRIDFDFVADNAHRVAGDDPVWGLRRAALLYWVGEIEESARIISVSVRELRSRVLKNPDSVALRSRLAWAKALGRALRWEDEGALSAELDGLDRLELRDYDPWGQVRSIDAEVEEGLRKRLESKPIEPRFDAGTYHDNRNTIVFNSSTQINLYDELRYIAERAGLPVRTKYVNLFGTRFSDALRLNFEPTATWHTLLLSSKIDYEKGPIDNHFGRISLARLSKEAVKKIQHRLEQAIKFWRSRVVMKGNRLKDVDLLRLFVEALSRITARSDHETAKSHALLAIDLAGDAGLNHWWLNEPIGHLLNRAIDAVPPNERGRLSAGLLQFPMSVERSSESQSRSWYDPSQDAYRFVRRSENEGVFDARVAVFLQYLATDGFARSEAASRILYLHEEGQLTNEQTSAFAEALWKGVPQEGTALPENTNLLLHAFLIAPAPPGFDVRARVYEHLFAAGNTPDPVHLVRAASGRNFYLRPNETDAERLFSNITNWRPEKLDPNSISDAFSRSFREEGDSMMVSVLGITAAPSLAQDHRTTERAEAVLKLLEETKLLEALAALPVFYGLDAELDRQIVSAFRQPLSIADRQNTPTVVRALDHWLQLSESNQAPPLPEVLRDRALRALERGRSGGLSSLIYLTRRLIELDYCGNPELDRIVEFLGELRGTTDYATPNGDADLEPDHVICLPIIRIECVRLANELHKKGVTIETVQHWLRLADEDPLPEVRYSLDGLNS